MAYRNLSMAFSLLAATTLHAQQTAQSLAGDWRFRCDEQKSGVGQKWYAAPLDGTQTIRWPGTMDDAGLGPKNTKPPTLAGPYRLYDYAGPAWYQREIEIPEAWRGQRVTLFLERCRWVTTAWLDDRLIGTQDSLIAPHVHDIGVGVAPGKHRLTLCVDNTVKLDLGRFVSALFGGTWGNMNGVIGRIELAATPPVWLADLQVYPDAAGRAATVRARIGNATGQAGAGRFQVTGVRWQDGKQTPATLADMAAHWDAQGGAVEARIELGPEAPLWDECEPRLHTVEARLKPEAPGLDPHGCRARFGLRDFGARGTQLTLNGRPVYLRGTLECSVFPLTGYPPMEPAAWQRIYRIMKSYGLNHIRFHSWCPPDAAFAAADMEGIIVQAEGPMANVSAGSAPPRDAFIEAEYKRIVDAYGNHPSFCLMALGNEFGGKDDVLTRWVGMLKERDPRRLYTSASNNRQVTANRGFTVTPAGRGIPAPSTQRDLRDVVAGDPRPMIGHEIGQWMYFPDFNEIRKYSGVMAAKHFEMIRDDLEKKNLLDLAPQYVQASGKLATLLYKEEIEVLLRTPGYGGFQLLDLHDYPTQGTALIGPLDAFWDSKGFISPEAFRRFCGPTVPLLRLPKRTYAVGESVTGSVEIAHFGPAGLKGVQPRWQVSDEQGRAIASGKLPALELPTGKLSPVGVIGAPLAKAVAPCKLTVTVSLEGTPFANDWEIWVYPDESAPQPPAAIAVCRSWPEARAALAGGQSVLLFPSKRDLSKSFAGRLLPVFWSPVWFPSQKPNTMGILCDPGQPVFAQFPTESHGNWQWWDVLQASRSVILDDTPAGFRPLVQVIDNFQRNHKLANLFEARVGPGRLLVCAIDLEQKPGGSPALRQFAKSVYAYLASGTFAPRQSLDAATLDRVFVPPAVDSALVKLGAKVLRADSEAPDYPAAQALDGDRDTIWHTAWDPAPAPLPHELVVDLGRPVELRGVTYLPRQDMANGRIGRLEVYCGETPGAWGQPVARADFKSGEALQRVDFKAAVRARYVKFVAASEVKGQAFTSVAEFDVLTP